MTALFVEGVRAIFRSKPRVAGLLTLAILTGLWRGPGASAIGSAILAVVAGAGAVSQQTASSELVLVFCRPVVRRTYVVAKFLAVLAVAAAMVLMAFLVGVGRFGGPAEQDLPWSLLSNLSHAAGAAAVVVLLSILLPRGGDAVAWAILTAIGAVAELYGAFNGMPAVAWTGTAIRWVMAPGISPSGPIQSLSVLTEAIRLLAIIVLAVGLGSWRLNNRDFSYVA